LSSSFILVLFFSLVHISVGIESLHCNLSTFIIDVVDRSLLFYNLNQFKYNNNSGGSSGGGWDYIVVVVIGIILYYNVIIVYGVEWVYNNY